MLRVQPLTPVKIDYQVLGLKEFTARFPVLVSSPGALRLHISPFEGRIIVERRHHDETANVSRSGIWQIRKSVMRNVLPAFGSTVGSVLAGPGLRSAMMATGVHRALRATLDPRHAAWSCMPTRWMRELPQEAWRSRSTYTLWGFPQAEFPKVLGQYFSFCKAHYKQHRYRCNVVNGAARLHQDRGTLISVSYSGPMITLQPSSTGEKGWDEFLIDFNDFASPAGVAFPRSIRRVRCSRNITRAFADRAKLFRALRQRTDPLNRLRNSYFAYLLG